MSWSLFSSLCLISMYVPAIALWLSMSHVQIQINHNQMDSFVSPWNDHQRQRRAAAAISLIDECESISCQVSFRYFAERNGEREGKLENQVLCMYVYVCRFTFMRSDANFPFRYIPFLNSFTCQKIRI